MVNETSILSDISIQIKRDSKSNWSINNPILLDGEIGYETDSKSFKIGNGSSNWNDLAYIESNLAKTLSDKIEGYLPLKGGRLTGALVLNYQNESGDYSDSPYIDLRTRLGTTHYHTFIQGVRGDVPSINIRSGVDGAPINKNTRIRGVADGTTDYDAVNFLQLKSYVSNAISNLQSQLASVLNIDVASLSIPDEVPTLEDTE